MISLWILAILVVFAVGLGHRASINLRLARYQRDRLKAYFLAKAGIQKAIVQLENDKNGYDNLDETWSTGIDSVTKKPLFENAEINEGSGETFTIRYLYDKEKGIYLCMSDEERKININFLDKKQLKQLFILRGLDADAESLAKTIFEWISGSGTEEEKKVFKNERLKTPEELLLILEYFYQQKRLDNFKEKAREVFNNVEDLITTYGGNSNTVNINTISENVLNIFANIVADDVQRSCANCVAQKIIELRNYQTEKCFKNKDGINLDVNECPPAAGGLVDILKANFIIFESDNFKIESTGNVNNVSKKITAIYNRQEENKKILNWHEN